VTTFITDFPPSLGQEVAGGQHYMIIDSYESKSSVAHDASKHLSSIGLYIPAGSLSTGYDGNYEGKEGGSLKAELGSDVMSALSGSGGGGDKSRAGGVDVAKLTAAVVTAAKGQASKMAAAKADTGGFISASGNSPNNYMALVYGGPNTFREHAFAFKFFPKNLTESNTVRAIIEEFKRGTLPRMSNITGGAVTGSTLTDPFFKSPRQHIIKFMHGGSRSSGGSNPYLFEIGKSVITDMKINYDPQSMVGFHSDGSPVQIDMSLTFKEIAFQISQDNVSGQANFDLPAAISQNQSSSTQSAEEFTNTRLADFARTGDTSRGF
jgi:hypothetical protein